MVKQAHIRKPMPLTTSVTPPAPRSGVVAGVNGKGAVRIGVPGEARIEIGPLVEKSRVTELHGRPYPVQLRNQGAFEAWERSMGMTDEWVRWTNTQTTCWDIRQEIEWQLNNMYAQSRGLSDSESQARAKARVQAVSISANLKYELQKGTVIEATPVLETLLTNSDVDLKLPMNMVAPPYCAQYLKFGSQAAQQLKVPNSDLPDRTFDGVFCFFTPPSGQCADSPTKWTLELIFITRRQGCYNGHVALLGETERDDTPLGEWLNKVLDTVEGQSAEAYYRPMHAAVSYVVKVFLYMALRQARKIEHSDYSEAAKRIGGVGVKKRARLIQRMASLYNGILVGPPYLPEETTASAGGGAMAPHWRRGHFRMQPCGPGRRERKLIFVAPVLIHAEQLQGEVPRPKSYRAGGTAGEGGALAV
jgi:hypothetical protein